MNSAAVLHLAWKEYRAIRGFWLSIVVLVVLGQATAMALSEPGSSRVNWLYYLALAAPAFFALGCAGTAFAIEREEGTLDFLRASPISAQEVLTSKLGVAFAATTAQFAFLWAVAFLFSRDNLPTTTTLNGMLALWLIGALEAIAWGTFFSLRSARPLLAICLALVTSTTVTHLLAWSTATRGTNLLDLSHYLAASPWRIAIASAVLALDVYLGLHWLGNDEAAVARLRLPISRSKQPPLVTATTPIGELLRQPDRSAILGHLLWQNARQSARLMALMFFLQFGLTLLFLAFLATGEPQAVAFIVFPAVSLTAVAGSLVFRPDQERFQFRFFVEHNVPARWVWFTRQSAWLAVVALSTLVEAGVVLSVVFLRRGHWQTQTAWAELVMSLGLYVGAIAAAYAAGQWTSMFVRSGLMAGFFALLIGGGLCGWLAVTTVMHVSWIFSVLPLCLVLLWATWLRAPDWVREDTSWRARTLATAGVLAPTLATIVAVGAYRICQVPPADPGFDPQAYLAEVTPESKETAELYRRANDLYVSVRLTEEEFELYRTGTSAEFSDYEKRTKIEKERRLLEDNAECLATLLEASRRPRCTLYDPRAPRDNVRLHNGDWMIRLVFISGEDLARKGNLAEALERFLVVFRIISHWADHVPTRIYQPWMLDYSAKRAFDQVAKWGTQDGQTSERIRSALQEVRALDHHVMRLDDGIKSNYLLARNCLLGVPADRSLLADHGQYGTAHRLWFTFLPWETTRALRLQNVITRTALARLEQFRAGLEEAQGVGHMISRIDGYPRHILSDKYTGLGDKNSAKVAEQELVDYEDAHRAAMLRLALAAYRLEHGSLPIALSQLVGPYFDVLPVDPYSGREYVYLPAGVPAPATPLDAADLADAQEHRSGIQVGKPGIWSSGPNLQVRISRAELESEPAENQTTDGNGQLVYYVSQYPGDGECRLPFYKTLAMGHWYPLAE
jgi:hypothetical protein